MEPIEIETDGGGVLSFDGRVIEFFDERQHVSTWRIHRSHIREWVVERRDDSTSRVKVMVTKRNFQNFLVTDAQRADFERLRAAVDAAG